ncbi:hypothetical protein BEI67_03855 [Photobacterium damselae subsp. piscicida]|nr:hypothetical protein BEI67_03855 [Photobacterium damselae subsp. piscicida]
MIVGEKGRKGEKVLGRAGKEGRSRAKSLTLYRTVSNFSTSKPRNLETSKPRNLETSKPRNLETSKPRNLETSKPRNLETSKPRNLETSKFKFSQDDTGKEAYKEASQRHLSIL